MVNGYKWRGFINGIHKFTKRAKDGGYWLIIITDQDIEDGGWRDLLDKEISSVDPITENKNKQHF